MSKKDEEKALEIGKNWFDAKCLGVPMDSDIVAEKAALEMAAWKDKQFSDRVEMTLCIDCHEFESCDDCPKYKLKKELLAL